MNQPLIEANLLIEDEATAANVAEMATILSTGSALNLRAGDWTIRTTVVAAERDSEPAE